MSASLVGSEMCIRDRPPSAARGRANVGAPELQQRARPAAPAYTDTPMPCLLYTSDAADDM
eukprot:14723087-Alexandrium_andersonii.AAC.1